MGPDDIIRKSHFDVSTGLMHNEVIYNNTEIIEGNKRIKNNASETATYKSGNSQLVHVGRMSLGDVERLANLGFNLLSPDMDERRRALVYIQENEKHLLLVPGKPFARKRAKWE